MPAPLNADSIRRAPKVLLHDHLDGGLRPQTVLELADEAGYRDLPTEDADELGRTALVLAAWCVVGLVLCVATFRWQERGSR